MFHSSKHLKQQPEFPTFLSQVRIEHGPRAQLSRFLLAANSALEDKGLNLRQTSFDELHAVYKIHEKSWTTLVPFFNATISPIDDANAACFVVYDDDGEPVSTTAVRVWNFVDTNLRAELESLRMLYGQQSEARLRGADCQVTAPTAGLLNGRILYCGAYWVRPDYRGKGLGLIVPAMSRFYALGRWAIDYKVTFGTRAFLAPDLRELYQYEDYEGDFILSERDKFTFRWLILWARTSFMLDQLPQLTKAIGSSVSSAPDGRAQHPAVR